MFSSIDEVQQALEKEKYICDRSLATVLYLALKLEKPILLEGEAGVGKTEVAKVMTQALGRRLIRLQCYEGLDVTTALYEWNYPKQLLRIKMGEASKQPLERVENIFSREFLIARPLLEAIQSEVADQHIVLLIDEVDRSDEEFEAFLLEILSDFQITIPEVGTISAKHRPLVIITSNRTREIHDALKRRCLYHWIDYPSFEKEFRILTLKVPAIKETLAEQICQFMQTVRGKDFYKKPGIAETLDWANALIHLHKDHLDRSAVEETLGCILKHFEDVKKMKETDLQSCLAAVSN
ncbi:MAG: ATPase [Deltaproteobacteria bacterium RBG_13_53_10]|nr:MAG: ATPase [Deltaproteobacteria bacterium RBG_13_53_10]